MSGNPKSPRRLQLVDLERASMNLRKKSNNSVQFSIFSFSTENNPHDLFIIESQEMTQQDGLLYVELSIRPFRKPHMREIIFSCFFEGEKFKLASIELMFDFHFDGLYDVIKKLRTSTMESSIFNIATELFQSKFDITMFTRDMPIWDENDELHFNPYYNRVQHSLSVRPFKRTRHDEILEKK
jgi:hypothetical protein